MRRQGSLVAGCNGTCSPPSAVHIVLSYLQSALSHHKKLHFGLEKFINSTFFAAGGNNALDLISSLIEPQNVIFCKIIS